MEDIGISNLYTDVTYCVAEHRSHRTPSDRHSFGKGSSGDAESPFVQLVAEPAIEVEAVRVDPHRHDRAPGAQAIDGPCVLRDRAAGRSYVSPRDSLGRHDLPTSKVEPDAVTFHQFLDPGLGPAQDVAQLERADRSRPARPEHPRTFGHSEPHLSVGLGQFQQPLQVM